MAFLSTHTTRPQTHLPTLTTKQQHHHNNGHPFGKETFITNLFRKTNLRIAFRTNNTIQKLLTPKHKPTDK
jgi:hypothetical protein